MISSKSSKLVCLPELLSPIFECLEHDRPSLRNASLVNLTWFEEAINVLWRHAPVTALMNVESTRRQIYASKLRSLSLSSDNNDRLHSNLRTLTFPRLRRLSATAFNSGDGSKVYIDQYFPASLEAIFLDQGNLGEYLLDYTSSELPRLRYIVIHSLPSRVDASRFLSFLQNHPSLNSMIFTDGMEHVITDQTLKYLIGRKSIIELKLSRLFRRAAIEKAIAVALPPFQNLYTLEMRIESNSISPLVSALSNGPIRRLSLHIEDDEEFILDHISSLTQLLSLIVTYHRSREIPRNEMITIRKLGQLQILCLGSIDDDEELTSFGMKDEDMQQLTTHLKQLRIFQFLVQSNLSIGAIVAIAKNCPTLKILCMDGVYDLKKLASTQEVLFPVLENLTLGSARVQDPQDQYVPSCSTFSIFRQNTILFLLNNISTFDHLG